MDYKFEAAMWYFWTDFFGIFYGHFPNIRLGIESTVVSFKYLVREL